MRRIIKMMGIFIGSFILGLSLISVILINHYKAFGQRPDNEHLIKIQHSPQFSQGKFHNNQPIKDTFGFSDYWQMVKMLVKGNPKRRPQKNLPQINLNKTQLANLPDSPASLVWFGHSAFLLKMDQKVILIDPMLGQSPSPLPFLIQKRFNGELPINIDDLPEIDAVILSHDHYDHLDYGTILKVDGKVKAYFVPLGVNSHLERWGVNANKIHTLDWWEEIKLGEVTLVSTPTQHFSGRSINDKFTTLWCSWVIQGKNEKIFFSGDSGYFDGFKSIGEKYGPFDVCLLECGQYNQLWSDIHMLPEETAKAHLDLKGEKLMPIHWGAFSLSMHDWNEPVERLSKVSKELGIELIIPKIGEPVLIHNKTYSNPWWKN